jgi:nitroreductase
MLLGAVAAGLGGCTIGSINKEDLRRLLAVPERMEILLVLAFGAPAEKIVIEDAPPGADRAAIRYWRDESGTHHVPKRPLEELILARHDTENRS